LCASPIGRPIKRLRKFIEINLVGVGLRGVGARVAHQPVQCDKVAAALTEEAVREAVSELVRGKATNARALADRQTIRINACALAGFFGSFCRRTRSYCETHCSISTVKT
jgi:hypothetical protein